MLMEAYGEARDAGLSINDASAYADYVVKRVKIQKTGRAGFKDGSQSKVYNAEHEFIRQYEAAGFSVKQFADYSEAAQYIHKVLKSKTWSKLSDRTSIRLIEKKDMGSKSASAGMSWGDKIQLCPYYGMNEYVLLHELAHSAGHMHHDVSFRQCLVKLVSRFMGREAAGRLKTEFKKAGLKMSRKKAIMSPEQWLVARDRMAALRAKK